MRTRDDAVCTFLRRKHDRGALVGQHLRCAVLLEHATEVIEISALVVTSMQACGWVVCSDQRGVVRVRARVPTCGKRRLIVKNPSGDRVTWRSRAGTSLTLCSSGVSQPREGERKEDGWLQSREMKRREMSTRVRVLP
jgi:hypothetical protein